MTSWPKNPVIYEINTWVWLNDLSRQYSRAITLGNVPTEKWDAIASLSIDASESGAVGQIIQVTST